MGKADTGGIGRGLHKRGRNKADSVGGETGMKRELYNKILKIFYLCIRISQPKGPTIFLDYAGHTDGVTVQIFSDGWEGERLPDKVYKIWLDGTNENLLKANTCLAYLRYLEALQREKAYQEKSPCGNTD